MTDGERMKKLMQLTLLAEAIFWIGAGAAYSLKPSGLTFLYPGFFWVLLVIPALFAAFFSRWQWKDKLYAKYRGLGPTRMIWVTFNPVRYFVSWFLLRTTVFFIVLTMAQPALGSQKIKGSKRVLDLVICLDISSSMNTMDIAPNTSRLEAAKRAIVQLINNLKGERISIVVFANEAYTQLPLTMDYGAAKMFISEIETSMISSQGTNIGAALETALTQFVDGESGHAVVVITDGEDHEQLWQEQTKIINEKKIELSYFGIGTEAGGKIPLDPTNPAAGYKKDGASEVISRLNPAGLKKMAAETNSAVEFSSGAFPDMTELIASLTSVQNKEVREIEFSIQQNYYRVPLLLALACFLSWLFVPLIMKRAQ